jgi:uncharacterized protein
LGPTNQGLLKYFKADQAAREVRGRLDAVTRNARLVRTRVDQLTVELTAAKQKLTEVEAKAKELELEVKSLEQRIELLRERQNNATAQREYQALIVEINTHKVDKGKLEDEALKAIDAGAAQRKVVDDLSARLSAETEKLKTAEGQIDTQVKTLEAELAQHDAPLAEAASAVEPRLLSLYQRAAEKYDGEGMAAIDRPSPRDEEFLCTGCHTYLITDIYNRLRSKDEAVVCSFCGRLLFIPEELTPDKAIKQKKPEKADKPAGEKKPRAKKAKAAAAAETSDAAPTDDTTVATGESDTR